jgi:hypothetical protein
MPALPALISAPGAMGFEETFIGIEVLRTEAGIEVFGIDAEKSDKLFHHLIKGFVAP